AIETTLWAIEWAIAELVNHPEIQQKLRQELDAVLGPGHQITEPDTHKLPYLQAVIKESLRLRMAIPLLVPHMNLHDAKLDSYNIPAESKVLVNAWYLANNPDSWRRPEEFRPERFLEEEKHVEANGNDFRYLPFGVGRRSCPGIILALPILGITIGRLVQNFELLPPPGKDKLDATEKGGQFSLHILNHSTIVGPSPRARFVFPFLSRSHLTLLDATSPPPRIYLAASARGPPTAARRQSRRRKHRAGIRLGIDHRRRRAKCSSSSRRWSRDPDRASRTSPTASASPTPPPGAHGRTTRAPPRHWAEVLTPKLAATDSLLDDGSPVSIFSLSGSNPQDRHLVAGRNGVKRLRTVRHPNILSFLHSTEAEVPDGPAMKHTIYIVTEPVIPLSEKLKELNLGGTQRDEYFAWGLHQISKAVSFLNNDCKLVHGNVCLASVVVTQTLDWKLHAFDVLSEFDANNEASGSPMLSLLPDYQRLLNSTPSRRLNPSKLIDNSEFFQNKLVETIQFMEVLNLKDSVEKDSFFRKLPNIAEQLPREIVLKKLLPVLASSLEFGSAAAPALTVLLKMGSWLPADQFSIKVLPTIVKLFASNDRAIRACLLQHIDQFGESLSAQTVDEQVFPNVATGFSDTAGSIRELTLKSMLVLAPKVSCFYPRRKQRPYIYYFGNQFRHVFSFVLEMYFSELSQRTISGSLLKYLSKLQVDEEPGIRTNTTILLGNIASYMNDGVCLKDTTIILPVFLVMCYLDMVHVSVKDMLVFTADLTTRKRVLINAFTVRALRDTFPPARAAGIMALSVTSSYYEMTEIATRILPNIVVLTFDPDSDVRTKAFQATDQFLQIAKQHHQKLTTGDNMVAESTSVQLKPGNAGLLGWAMSSITQKGKPSDQGSISTTNANNSKVSATSTANPGIGTQASTVGYAPSTSSSLDQAAPASASSSVDGWGELEDGNVNEENGSDKEGWDDVDPFDDKPSPSLLSNIQAAQKRPVVQPKQAIANPSKSHQLKAPKSEDDPLWGPIAAAPPKSASKPADIKPSTSHNDEDDLWGSIAAPAPKSSGKPLKAAAANSDDLWGAIAAPPPATKARPLASSGRGRGTKPAQPKLGAQRIGRTSSTGM
ncbi:Trans-cinnamate 4-monooxygenase, partial [Dichanthelium oligosanthes]